MDYISICSDFNTKESLVRAYAQLVELIGDVADWEVPYKISEIHVYPPVETPPSGHRKKFRIPSANEDVNRRIVKCGWCNELGHNRKRYKNFKSKIVALFQVIMYNDFLFFVYWTIIYNEVNFILFIIKK